MTQGDRIKAIKKHFKLTMEKFGNKLGVTKVPVAKEYHESLCVNY